MIRKQAYSMITVILLATSMASSIAALRLHLMTSEQLPPAASSIEEEISKLGTEFLENDDVTHDIDSLFNQIMLVNSTADMESEG